MIKSCKLLLKVWNLFKGLWYLIVKFLTQVTSNLFVKKEKLPALLEALLDATLQSEKKGIRFKISRNLNYHGGRF